MNTDLPLQYKIALLFGFAEIRIPLPLSVEGMEA